MSRLSMAKSLGKAAFNCVFRSAQYRAGSRHTTLRGLDLLVQDPVAESAARGELERRILRGEINPRNLVKHLNLVETLFSSNDVIKLTRVLLQSILAERGAMVVDYQERTVGDPITYVADESRTIAHHMYKKRFVALRSGYGFDVSFLRLADRILDMEIISLDDFGARNAGLLSKYRELRRLAPNEYQKVLNGIPVEIVLEDLAVYTGD